MLLTDVVEKMKHMLLYVQYIFQVNLAVFKTVAQRGHYFLKLSVEASSKPTHSISVYLNSN